MFIVGQEQLCSPPIPKTMPAIWKIGLDRDYRAIKPVSASRKEGVKTLHIPWNVSWHCGKVTMEQTNMTKCLHTRTHSSDTSDISVKRPLKKLWSKTLFLRRIRTEKTTANSAWFAYTLLIFGNRDPHRLSIVFVHFQVCTLKWQKDTRDMTFFKEALTQCQRCLHGEIQPVTLQNVGIYTTLLQGQR